jgi:two-component system chemotaxis response regulator CheY
MVKGWKTNDRSAGARLSWRGRIMDARKHLELLIVEDRQVMLKIIRRLLLQLGYTRVDEAANGLHALEKIDQKRYDLILSDWNMDGMSGFDLLKAVRARPESQETPFILVTAESKPENILAARAAGASGYLVKPFKLDMFEKTLDHVLAANGFVHLAVA